MIINSISVDIAEGLGIDYSIINIFKIGETENRYKSHCINQCLTSLDLTKLVF
jgi:hypothetical protein